MLSVGYLYTRKITNFCQLLMFALAKFNKKLMSDFFRQNRAKITNL